MAIEGTGRLTGSAVQSHGDHRLAMALAVAGLVSRGNTVVEEAEAADVSYPQFWEHLRGLRGEAEILAPPVETAP
jgi:3-phosphoshikimate 1-carboxyvinyltransferase